MVEKGDNIVVLTSGRADDIQNLKARDDNRAFILIGEWYGECLAMTSKKTQILA